jgi:hypothetical protein
VSHNSAFHRDRKRTGAFHLVYGFGIEATAPVTIFGGAVHGRNLLRVSIKRQHFAGFALDGDFERMTANFAIRRETLIANRRVELQVEATSTEGALNFFGQLHTGSNYKKITPLFSLCN